jgi:hypothetical protein
MRVSSRESGKFAAEFLAQQVSNLLRLDVPHLVVFPCEW